MRYLTFFLTMTVIFSLTACSKSSTYKYKLKPSKNIVSLQEFKTIYHVGWPLTKTQQDTFKKHRSAKWLHVDLYAQPAFAQLRLLEEWLKENLPTIRHIKWYDDTYQKPGTVRVVVSDYKPLSPLGPNWYLPNENQPLWDHGRAKATNLGAMLDDPYELKITDPIGPTPASRQGNLPKEVIKIDVETS